MTSPVVTDDTLVSYLTVGEAKIVALLAGFICGVVVFSLLARVVSR